MILQASGDIFASPADILVNPVNCVGVMGAGLAKQFAARFPEIVYPYREACYRGQMENNRAIPFTTKSDKVVICAATKYHWRESSTLAAVESALCEIEWIVSCHSENLVVALPLLGTGLGGLDKKPVRELTYQYLDPLPHTVWLYE